MKFAIDDNLGIPADFAARFDCQLVEFHELGEMLAAFSSGEVAAMFAPCGTLPCLTAPYEILGQATRGRERTQSMESRFVVREGTSWDANILTRGTIGCVNRYCTTSFWAPMLARLDETPAGSPIKFQETAGFADMLFAVVDGRVDGAMVWTAVLEEHRDAWSKTREIFRITNLPSPAIVANATLGSREKEAFKSGLASYSTDSPGFFSGFAAPDLTSISAFVKRDVAAREHYRI